MTSEAVVDLEQKQITSWIDVGTSGPPTQALAAARSREILSSDPDFIAALEQLKIDSPNDLGYYTVRVGSEKYPDLYSCFMWVNEAEYQDELFYTLAAQYDGKTGEIYGAQSKFGKYSILTDKELRLADFVANRPSSEAVISTDADWPERKPLSITQQQGTGFEINGSKVSWQNWQIHFGMSPRRALEVFDVSFQSQGRQRSILYRAGLTEAVTPYGDPDYRSWYPSDVGDMMMANYGLRPMILGEDTPPNAVLLPATVHNHLGEPMQIERAIAIYERDGGIAWRHNNQSRRARELVLKTNVVIDNYDFSMSWIFNQAGGIEAEMVLSGQVQFYPYPTEKEKLVLADRSKHFFTVVGPRLAAPLHQHYFNYRIDLDVDGIQNNVYEMNLASENQEDDPAHEWFYYQAKHLKGESMAQREPSVHMSRHWRVSNDTKNQAPDQSPAYFLMPTGTAFPKVGAESPVMKQYGFLKHHLWVTPYVAQERHAAGDYVHPELPGSGLPEWTQANRNLENEDLVLWYTFGMTHLPRPEDWPYMPIHRSGFKLWPFGFFKENPVIGMPVPNPW
ncbi:MAG TPA: hypothetical protein VJ953_03065 [Saprospiraceae bacterium]|nr:hypothetical protein [Saprospiraceae bacterium]